MSSVENLIIGISFKSAILLSFGFVSSKMGKDLINYKTNKISQFLIFMSLEEGINYFLPSFLKGNNEAKINREGKLTLSDPTNIEPTPNPHQDL